MSENTQRSDAVGPDDSEPTEVLPARPLAGSTSEIPRASEPSPAAASSPEPPTERIDRPGAEALSAGESTVDERSAPVAEAASTGHSTPTGQFAMADQPAAAGEPTPTAEARPATPVVVAPSGPRVGTVVWGLVILAIGLGIIATAAGARIDLTLAAILLLGGAGVALVAGSIVSSLRRRGDT